MNYFNSVFRFSKASVFLRCKRLLNQFRFKCPRVLVLGVYLADRKNLVGHVVKSLGESTKFRVTQRWAAINGEAPARYVDRVTYIKTRQNIPKFTLLNRLLDGVNYLIYDFIVLCDDDIHMPPDFLDRLLELQNKYDFALAQPARTHNSYTDHRIVEQVNGLEARRTRFVEIGPVVSMRRDAVTLLMPFDETCGMGWGLDFLWPVRIELSALKMGIIDDIAVAHALRPAAKSYGFEDAMIQMHAFLAGKAHLTMDEAMVVLERHAK